MKNHVAPTWWDEVMSYFEGYPSWLVEFSISAAIGFVFGFVLKNFGKYIIFAVVTGFAAAYILDYFALATFHLVQIKQILGISTFTAVDLDFKSIVAWGRTNIPICSGLLVGFTFGWKVGH